MDPVYLAGLDELLEHALALPKDQRLTWLAEVRERDPEKADRLSSLIEDHDAGEIWFNELGRSLAADADLEVEAAATRRILIGPWRVLGLIGRGGMGAVYLVERADGQFEQRAALKLARAGFDDTLAARRFAAERQILAGLEHPNIARLIDGGVAFDGRPYFAMELVEGEPLPAYADRHNLTVNERLTLFLQLGDAVSYAHRHLVVHRDLKPSNVLVTANGSVKLLDFGIAKLFDPEDGAEEDGTRTRERAVTPAYGAPEQIAGAPITTATDVYSLGVVLYELLCGRRPFESADRSTHDLEQDVLSKEPERPSQNVRNLAEAAATEIAARRRTGRERLLRRLRGDLDVVCLTALQKTPSRRYPSADRLMDDIRRHLHGLPITARPDRISYRASKFLKRHWAGASMAALLVLLLLASALIFARQSAVTATERDKAQQVAALLVEVFQVADPSEARGAQVTAREVLDRAVTRVESMSGQPALQAELLSVLGRVHRNLGLYERAAALNARTESLLASLEGPTAARTIREKGRRGELQYLMGKYKEAEATLRAVLALQEQHDREGADVVVTLNHLGKVLQAQGRPDDAESVLRRALESGRRAFGEQHGEVADALSNLGAVMFLRGRLDATEPYFRDALAIRRAVLGDDHPLVPASINNLATLLSRKGDLAGAEALNRQALALATRVYGPDHPRVATMSNNLGLTLFARGDAVSAEIPLRASLEVRRKTLGSKHPETAQSLANLSLILQTLGRYAEAGPLVEEALVIRRSTLGPGHPLVAQTLNNLGLLAESNGDRAKAETAFREAINTLRGSLAPGHLDLAFPLFNLGRLLRRAGRLAEAEPLLAEAVAARRAHLPVGHKDLVETERLLAECRKRLGVARPLT